MTFSFAPPQRLLSLRDEHGAPLADYDWYQPLDLLHVHWHGHLTAASLIRGVQAGMELPRFRGQALPRRVVTNHERASGSWEEALPWLQYDWLPRAHAQGLRRLAHLISHNPANRFGTQPDQLDFAAALRQVCQARSFRTLPAAWHWLTQH